MYATHCTWRGTAAVTTQTTTSSSSSSAAAAAAWPARLAVNVSENGSDLVTEMSSHV